MQKLENYDVLLNLLIKVFQPVNQNKFIYKLYLFKLGNVSWEQVLQNGSTNGINPFNGQNDGSNSMSITTTTTVPNLAANVDLRRQSTRHFSGMIKCNPQETERITDAVVIGSVFFVFPNLINIFCICRIETSFSGEISSWTSSLYTIYVY
jgi:hypothetical protein